MRLVRESPQVVARGRVEPARGLSAGPALRTRPRARRRGGGSGGNDGGPFAVFSVPKATVGLWVFMGVVSILFSIVVSTYLARMRFVDWDPLPEPRLLWFNTGLLCLSSVAMEWARRAARRGSIESIRIGLAAGGLCAGVFIAGQLWAWQELRALGYFVASNPANTFFYLITALHGLHLLGGLAAGGVTTARLSRAHDIAAVRLHVELCAIYWHFLLGVWVVVFGLLLLT